MQGKVTSKDSAAARVYVGIDVCKKWLDIAIHPIGRTERFENTAKGLKALLRCLAAHHVASVALEATGKLHRGAHRTLSDAGYATAVVNPFRSRLIAESAGVLAKTDRIDARLLAVMAECLKPATTAPPSERMEQLQELVRLRQAGVDDRTALGNQLGAATGAFAGRELVRRIKALDASIARIEAEIGRLINADAALRARFDIVASIPGVGPVAATALVVGLSELGTCSAKQAAMIAGLAPVACDSGEHKGARHIRGGRGDVRRSIYMAAVTAARCNPDLAAFYARLIANGKRPKVAVTAVMRKLVALANTLLTQNRHWKPQAPRNA